MNRQIPLMLTLCIAATHSWADTIEFSNGDRLQGKIVSMQGGSLTFDSAVVGEIDIPMENIKHFTTDEAIEIHLTDGTVLQQKVTSTTAAQGQVQVEQGSIIQGQSISIAQIGGINPPPEPEVEWEGRLSGGVNITTGNSESQDGYIDVDLKREGKIDRIMLGADYIENREENTGTGVTNTSKRRYALSGHYDYFVSDHYYVYADVGAEKEATANLDLLLKIGGGGGYAWIDSEKTSLDLEAGLSWVNQSFSDATEDKDYVAFRTGWRFEHLFDAKLNFFHKGEWLPGLEDWDQQLIKTETGIRSKISDVFFVEAKVIYDWNSEPALNKEKEDVIYNFGVGLDF